MDDIQLRWQLFVENWTDLYRDPVVCAVVAGAVLGYLGVFIVLRRVVFMTAAVSQGAGLGVALAVLAGNFGFDINPIVGAIAIALAVSAALAIPTDRIRYLSREGILGLLFLGCWAGGILVSDYVGRTASEHMAEKLQHIQGVLFGSAVAVRTLDLVLVVSIGGLVLLVHVLGQRGFVFATFDPESARVQGIPVKLLNVLSWILIALVISVCTRALGVLPVFAFAVLPALASLVLWERLAWVLPTAALLGATAGFAGYLFATFFDFPVGASQAVAALVLFLLCTPARFARRGFAQLSESYTANTDSR